MATFTVSFNCNNSAFDDGFDGRAELEMLLHGLADRIWETQDVEGLIRDSNGNHIGGWRWEREGD